MAKKYNYKHQEVFEMDWEFVYTLTFLGMQQDSIHRKAQEIRRLQNKRK